MAPNGGQEYTPENFDAKHSYSTKWVIGDCFDSQPR